MPIDSRALQRNGCQQDRVGAIESRRVIKASAVASEETQAYCDHQARKPICSICVHDQQMTLSVCSSTSSVQTIIARSWNSGPTNCAGRQQECVSAASPLRLLSQRQSWGKIADAFVRRAWCA